MTLREDKGVVYLFILESYFKKAAVVVFMPSVSRTINKHKQSHVERKNAPQTRYVNEYIIERPCLRACYHQQTVGQLPRLFSSCFYR